MVWTGQEIVTATAAAGDAAAVAAMCIDAVRTDSRQAGSGTLFVALRGERHDGHAFAAEALRGGATAVLVEHVSAGVDAPRALVVPDTLRALGDLASFTRQRWGGPAIAITGSNGKTTTKEMLGAICAAHPPWSSAGILKTHGNENNLIGLPLTLLRMRGDEGVAVLEMGMNAPGEIARMTEIARPDVGLVTNVGPAHLEGLGTVAGVAAAKGELFAGMRTDATIAVNLDDEWVMRVANVFRGRRVEFGTGGEVSASSIDDRAFDGLSFLLHIGAHRERVALRMAGRHNVQNALGAAAAAHALGVPLPTIAAGLSAAEPPKMRLQVVRLANGVTVVNDAYNANPASTEAALDAVGRSRGRAIAVLGEMRELGSESAALHRQIGAYAAGCGVRWVLAVGPQSEHIAAGARAAGGDVEVSVCDDAAGAAALLAERWQPGDTILIKGSRGPDSEEGVRRYGARMAEVAARLEAAGGRS